MANKILIVDDDRATRDDLAQLLTHEGYETLTASDVPTAMHILGASAPDLLITEIRLDTYNGLHLIYLAKANRHGTRSICYSMFVDLPLIKEAQEIGAFYEAPARVPFALLSYLRTALPPRDRRQPREGDRRKEFRGGRRSTDVAVVTQG